jgi:uncharacterized protein
MRLLIGLLAALALQAQSVEGIFLGELEAMGRKLRIGLEVRRDAKGDFSSQMTSLDQGYAKMAVATTTFTGQQLKLDLARSTVRYEATLSEDGNTLTGKFFQGMEFPLVMKRVAALPVPNRPQEPKPPYPYLSEDVVYPSAAEGVTLAATITRPKGSAKVPAAILISGSGPQNRDSLLAMHRPFLIWADHLTRAGFAVLRFDDRGTGKSTGTHKGSTSEDFAQDVRGALAYLRGRADIDTARLFLVGHSEGGIIAPMVAATDPKLAGIVTMAGPAVLGEKLLARQLVDLARSAGMPEDMAKANGDAQMKAIKAGLDADVWMKFFLAYDPAATLAKVKCPVLAINGDLDMQVNAADNLGRMAEVLPKATVKALPKLNHLLQTAANGSQLEYGALEESVAPIALETVTAWLKATAK